MENSLSPSVNKTLPPKETPAAAPEESGWTSYFEDFSNNREHSYCSSYGTTSLVSDAASCVAWKISDKNRAISCSPSMETSPKQELNFRQRKAKEIYHDDSLEDTASSPVNSPKVSDLKQMDINPRKADDNMDSSLGKGGVSDHEESQPQKNEMNFNGKNNDCSELRKRGLCLVPLSMLVKYFV
ncbi:hypothetical protein L1049_024033 [Liquidambar formosana]|uniref:Uncharacterized protein n=1 Tax=Liquidambar formosana TaxID=63359 RepID=A0AAP0RTU0_LIQFO